MRSGQDRFISLVVVLYILVGYSECQRSACVTSAGQSAVYLPETIVRSFNFSHDSCDSFSCESDSCDSDSCDSVSCKPSLHFPSSFKRLVLKTWTALSCSSSRPSSFNNLSCSKYEPLSLSASASAHSSWKTFEVFRLGVFFALEKVLDFFRFFFSRHFHYKQSDQAWQTNRAMQNKTCCASITSFLMAL